MARRRKLTEEKKNIIAGLIAATWKATKKWAMPAQLEKLFYHIR